MLLFMLLFMPVLMPVLMFAVVLPPGTIAPPGGARGIAPLAVHIPGT